MNWKKTFAIVRREYVERVRTKAFWIATLLIPILFLGYVAIQISISRKTGGERQIVVVDQTGTLFAPLVRRSSPTPRPSRRRTPRPKGPHWTLVERPRGRSRATKEALRKQVLAKKINGYLVLEPAKLREGRGRVLLDDGLGLHRPESAPVGDRTASGCARRWRPAGFRPTSPRSSRSAIDLKPFKVTEKGTAEEKGAGIIAAIIF